MKISSLWKLDFLKFQVYGNLILEISSLWKLDFKFKHLYICFAFEKLLELDYYLEQHSVTYLNNQLP